jgi:metal-sulfur cluster biosynthetic enzyme
MDADASYTYEGDPALQAPILGALRSVVDPEMALNIVDVGLVYRVTVDAARVHVLMTMTSAACPVADVILEDVQDALDRVLPPQLAVEVELFWDPPWTPERLSPRARAFMGW